MKHLYALLFLSIPAAAQQTPYYKIVYELPGSSATVLDLHASRILYWQDNAYHIRNFNTGTTTDIPLSKPPAMADRQTRQGWLTDSAAFFTTTSDQAGMVGLYEWRGGTLREIEKQANTVDVAGDYALWTSWGIFYHQRPREEKRRISDLPGAYAMSPAGWFLYSLRDTLYKYENGASTPYATGETTAETFSYVTIDGQQALFLLQKAAQPPALYLHNGTSAEMVTVLPGYHQARFPRQQYALRNGKVAWVSIDREGVWPISIAETSIYLKIPGAPVREAFKLVGNRNESFVFPEIKGIDERSGLLVRKENFSWQNGLHYAWPGGDSSYIAPYTVNAPLPGMARDSGNWYTFYGNTVYRIALDTPSTHTAEDFTVNVRPNTPYAFTLQQFLDHYTGVDEGPGQLSAVSFFLNTGNGYLRAGNDSIGTFAWVARERLDSVQYIPAAGFTGVDSIQWRADNGLSTTAQGIIRFVVAPACYTSLAVSLTADPNIVNNDRDSVRLTAHGNVGGSLFTFARDTGFTNLLRPESGDSVITLHPTALRRGDNYFYVKMRVAGCDSAARDQVRVVKTIFSNGDPVNAILAYPNPFTTQFTVEGLEKEKRYIITLHDLTGRPVQTWITSGSPKFTAIPPATLRKGVYFLKVFDDTTQRLAGGLVLLKI
ncbi:T9SS type A sorting domain-containing protein [Chitinophaga lutea]